MVWNCVVMVTILVTMIYSVSVVTTMVTVGRIGGWIISPIRASLYAQYLSI